MKVTLLSILLLIGLAGCSRHDMNALPDETVPLDKVKSTQEAVNPADPCANPDNPFDWVGHNHNLLLEDCAPLINNGTLSSEQAIRERISNTAQELFGVTNVSSPETGDWLQRQFESDFAHVTEEMPERTRPYLTRLTTSIGQAVAGVISYPALKKSIGQVEAAVAADKSLSAEDRLLIFVGTSIGRYTTYFWLHERETQYSPAARKRTDRDYSNAISYDIWAGVTDLKFGKGPVHAYQTAANFSAYYLYRIDNLP